MESEQMLVGMSGTMLVQHSSFTIQRCMALGVSLFLAAAYVRFRDVSYIWEVAMQGLFYLTPILYPLSIIPREIFKKFILLNPMAQAIQDGRHAVVTDQSETITQVFDGAYYRLLPLLIVVISIIIGTAYFKHESKHFAENL